MLCEDMLVMEMVVNLMMKIGRSYSEMIKLPTFEERFRYLELNGRVGETTFGSKRYLNQILYRTDEWLSVRDKIIIRDNGCDLGIRDRSIEGRVLVHHIEPITIEDVLNRNPKVFDPDNLITISHMTHEAVHYGDENLLIKDPIKRRKNDTCPWRRD